MKKVKVLAVIIICVFVSAGCDSIRFAPGQIQKQNAWLHNRTTRLTADLAAAEQTSPELKKLTSLGSIQSKAFLSYYGMPEQIPAADSIEDILSQASFSIADSALAASALRPDPWDTADGLLDFGIALAGLFGGVYGFKVARFLKQARAKSAALREIIEGNELLRQQGSETTAQFKTAHQKQSPTTRQIVTEIKGADS